MNNNDIILKADNLYFSYDDEKMVFPWRFQEARKLHLWVQMVPGNQLFSSAVPESTNQVRELFIITGNLILMTVKGF